jgi:glycosyltransferase involved in cell wall biosynthesis
MYLLFITTIVTVYTENLATIHAVAVKVRPSSAAAAAGGGGNAHSLHSTQQGVLQAAGEIHSITESIPPSMQSATARSVDDEPKRLTKLHPHVSEMMLNGRMFLPSAWYPPPPRPLKVVWEFHDSGCTGFGIEGMNVVLPFADLPAAAAANAKNSSHMKPGESVASDQIDPALPAMAIAGLAMEAMMQANGIGIASKGKDAEREDRLNQIRLGKLNPRNWIVDMAIIPSNSYCVGVRPAEIELLKHMADKIRNSQLAGDGEWDQIDVWISHRPASSFPDTFPKSYGNDGREVTISKRPHVIVARTMFESVPVPSDWGHLVNERTDELWVPARFLVKPFVDVGVDESHITVVPESVDTALYDADNTVAIEPERYNLKLRGFNFISQFKTEPRKGWHMLLHAFCTEFGPSDDVSLTVITFEYMGWNNRRDPDHLRDMFRSALHDNFQIDMDKQCPTINIIGDEVPTSDQPRIYKLMQAFVLPTRGEGWGLPITEAMSMGLPCIATGWSGPTEFMTAQNSLIIPITGMEQNPAESWTTKFAIPSFDHLKQAMRQVYRDPELAERIGARAKADIHAFFNRQTVADIYQSLFLHTVRRHGAVPDYPPWQQ